MKFTYTGMHGVGYEYVKKACQSFGFVEPIPVKEQASDSHFKFSSIVLAQSFNSLGLKEDVTRVVYFFHPG